jgi:hypothetical protein
MLMFLIIFYFAQIPKMNFGQSDTVSYPFIFFEEAILFGINRKFHLSTTPKFKKWKVGHNAFLVNILCNLYNFAFHIIYLFL